MSEFPIARATIVIIFKLVRGHDDTLLGGRHPRAATVRRREHEHRGATCHHREQHHYPRDHNDFPIPTETRGRGRQLWSAGRTE